MKHKIKIHWNAFWAIGGGMIGAILVTVATVISSNSDNQVNYGYAVLPYLMALLPILCLFFNRKPLRIVVFSLIFVIDFITVFLGAFDWVLIIAMSSSKGNTSLRGTEFIWIDLVAFLFFQLIGLSVWFGLQNTKDRKVMKENQQVFESQISDLGKMKFSWSGTIALGSALTFAIMLTLLVASVPTYNNDPHSGNGTPIGVYIIDVATVIAWLLVIPGVLALFFPNKGAVKSIFGVNLAFHILAAILILPGVFMGGIMMTSMLGMITNWVNPLVVGIVLDCQYNTWASKEFKKAN